MYSLSTRFNRIFFYGLINLVVLCVLNYLTGIYLIKDKHVDVKFKFTKHYYFINFRNEKYQLRWDDLSSAFNLSVKNMKNLDNWNLKQLFMYLEVVWDENGKR